MVEREASLQALWLSPFSHFSIQPIYVEERAGMESDAMGEGAASAMDWDNRRLCSDENCIGVIGSDGRCRECGKPAGDSPVEPASEPAAEDPVREKPAAAQAPAVADDWDNRRLCSDENCIGVIGSDGRCKECGKPHAG